MDFALNADQQAIVGNIEELCAGFDLDYWRKRDLDGGFPHDFHAAVAQAGYLGIAMPALYGGAGLGITEAVLVMQAISQSLSTVVDIRCNFPIRSRCVSRSRNDSKKGSLDSIASFPVCCARRRPASSRGDWEPQQISCRAGSCPHMFHFSRRRQTRPNNGRERPNYEAKIGSDGTRTEPIAALHWRSQDLRVTCFIS